MTSPPPSDGDAARLAATLERLDARLGRLEAALAERKMMEQRIGPMIAAAVDTFDSVAERASAAGFDFDVRLRALLRAADKLTSAEAISALEHTLHSGILDGEAVETVGHLGRAIATASHAESVAVTPWGLLRALRDPAVQRALGFLLTVARTFGASLGADAPAGESAPKQLAAPVPAR